MIGRLSADPQRGACPHVREDVGRCTETTSPNCCLGTAAGAAEGVLGTVPGGRYHESSSATVRSGVPRPDG